MEQSDKESALSSVCIFISALYDTSETVKSAHTNLICVGLKYLAKLTCLSGAVVNLSDSRLVGTEIKSQSRYRIFNLSIGSAQSECSARLIG